MQIKTIKILNRSLEVTYINGLSEIIYKTLETFFNDLLLDSLTTYKGRINAIKNKYHYKKCVPIYITSNCCFIPTTKLDDIDNLFINVYAILNIINQNDKTKIIFKDNTSIIINKRYQQFIINVKRANLIEPQ